MALCLSSRDRGKKIPAVGLMEEVMMRKLAFAVTGYAVITTASAWAADFGTAEEAKAMLERAVAAVKEERRRRLICSIMARAASRIETFMCGAPTRECPLLEGKRTSLIAAVMPANDPKQTHQQI